MKIQFKEVQKYSFWWLWLTLIALAVLPIYGIYKQLILGEQFGNNPMSDLGLIIFSISIFAIVLLFWVIALITEIDEEGIRLVFFPFIRRSVKWSEIQTAEIITYRSMGSGIITGTKYGTIYNTKGNKGLAIELKNGKKLCIGTQKTEALKALIEEAKKQEMLT